MFSGSLPHVATTFLIVRVIYQLILLIVSAGAAPRSIRVARRPPALCAARGS